MHSFAVASAIVLSILGTTLLPAQGLAHRVTVGLEGTDPDWLSLEPVLSIDGRYVAFQSYASNLVPNDTNGCSDVFLHDCVTGTTTRVSTSTSGAQGDLYSGEPAISPDGRFIVFRSDATNLVPRDTNGVADVFIHERITGRTQRISIGPAGTQPNGPSGRPSVSADGRYVAFESDAANLVPDDRNGVGDVFVRDRHGLVTTRISTGTSGEGDAASGSASISTDGRTVAFVSLASVFAHEAEIDPDVFLFDIRARKLNLVSADATGAAAGGEAPVISRDGSVVVFESSARLRAADTNPDRDVYAYRVAAKELLVASVSSTGAPGRRWVSTPEIGPATRIPADSAGPSVSGDGRYVAFVSLARDLVAGEMDGAEVYVRDLVLGTTRCVTADAVPGRTASSPCAIDSVLGAVECPAVRARISGSGLLIGVQTRGAFLPADKNGSDDIYVVDLKPPEPSARVKGDRKPEQGLSVR